jgi:multicomponent Na+:H+ antiporter subunit B
MNLKWRIRLFLLGAAVTAALYGWGIARLPEFGHYAGPYGDLANQAAIHSRHVTDTVSAINFDIRAMDTLGEEFILYASVLGAVVLLREAYEAKTRKHPDQAKDRSFVPDPSEAVQTWTLGMTGPTVLFGAYIVTHGQLTPGGGFQGGVILATAPLLIYLARDFETFKKVATQHWVDLGKVLGLIGFVCLGIAPLFWGRPFLENFLPFGGSTPYGEQGSPFSGGTMPLVSVATGLEVAGGFVLLLSAFLQETLSEQPDKKGEEGESQR